MKIYMSELSQAKKQPDEAGTLFLPDPKMLLKNTTKKSTR